MNKKYLLIILLGIFLSLSGCGNSTTTKIQFENFNLDLKTNQQYFINDIGDQNSGIIIYKGSDQEDSEFINSLVILSTPTKQNIKDFVDQNMNKLNSSISSIETTNTQTLSFNCSGTKTIGIIKSFLTNDDDIENYFSQYFFLYDEKGYIISFSSDNEDDNIDFQKSLTSLSCIK
ncbi:hypothetical protein K9M48_02890 [Candidatus Gracilibacteria bacterium]|nr:hypothetical protein [Candidatus Gracilibacteria bacterium]